MIGTLFALVGVLITSVYQIVSSAFSVYFMTRVTKQFRLFRNLQLVGAKQKELKLNSMQLLFYQAPLSAVMLMCLIPFIEPVVGEGSALDNVSVTKMMLVLLSCMVAYLVNVSIYWVIGNLSPVTYNMIGHLKFTAVLCGGFVFFQDPVSMYQGLGMLLTVSGVIAYTHIKMSEQKATIVKPPEPGLIEQVAAKHDNVVAISIPSRNQSPK